MHGVNCCQVKEVVRCSSTDHVGAMWRQIRAAAIQAAVMSDGLNRRKAWSANQSLYKMNNIFRTKRKNDIKLQEYGFYMDQNYQEIGN